MKRFLFTPVGLMAVLSVPVLLFSWYIATRDFEGPFDSSDPSSRRSRSASTGGVERPLSDISAERKLARSSSDSKPTGADNERIQHQFGKVTCPRVPMLAKGQNPQMDSVIEAMETKKYPERLSPLIQPVPFDIDAWRDDPKVYQYQDQSAVSSAQQTQSGFRLVSLQSSSGEYLDIAEPGRIYDVAQPVEQVKPLTTASASNFEMFDGEAVRLGVKTEPFGVATFTAFGVGRFDNGLLTMTVQADENGIATAIYVTSTGPELSEVVAGSPMTSGTVRFTLKRLFAPVADPTVDPTPEEPSQGNPQ
jgi:hypothetical protein